MDFQKQNLSQIIHQNYGHVSIVRPKQMARKLLMEGLPKNLPDLEEPCPICILTKSTKIIRGTTTDISKFATVFMLQMYYDFFNIECIRGLTSNVVATCSSHSYPFGFPSRNKPPPLNIMNFFVTTLINQYNKVSFIRVDEDGALERSSEFMNICHDMNITVQTTGVDTYCLNGKISGPNKTLYNISIDILLKSRHNKEIWLFSYMFAIWLFLRNENILRGDVPYFPFHGSIPP